MKKLVLIFSALCILVSGNLFAQGDPDPQKKDPAVKTTTYTIIGAAASLNYFLIEDSKPSVVAMFKTPLYKDHGFEMDLGTFNVPVTSYSLGSASYSGFGEENYLNVGVNYVYFFPFYRNFQLKAGLDYYHFLNGSIADSPTGADCGTLYTMCKNCIGNMYGLNIGVNLDVPLFDQVYAMTNVSYKYLLIHDQHKKGVVDMRIGLGYKLK